MNKIRVQGQSWSVVAIATTLVLLFAVQAGSGLAAQQLSRWTVSESPLLRIGTGEGDPSYTFDAIVGARFLPDGKIVIADGGYLDIRVFGRDGSLHHRFGGRGQGPGRFLYIGGLWLTKTGLIALWDPTNRRFSTFSSDGKLRSTILLGHNPLGGNLEVFFGTLSNDDVVLASLEFGPRSPQPVPDIWTLVQVGLNGEFRRSLGSVRGMWRVNRYPIPFSPMPSVVVNRDSLFIVDNYDALIEVRSGGSADRTIEVPGSIVSATPAAWSNLEAKLERLRKSLFLEYIRKERVPFDNKAPQIAGMLVDSHGYIWVKRYDPNTDPTWLKRNPMLPALGGDWLVIRPSGRPIATVRLPQNFRPLDVQADRLLGVMVDAFDAERPVVLKLSRR